MIRPLAPGDESGAFAVENACLNTAWSEKQIAESVKNGNKYFVHCGENGLITGIISAVFSCGECEIMNIAVIEEYRKKGVGSALLACIEDEAAKEGAEKIFLEVAETNKTAYEFYINHQFVCVGRRKGFYRGTDALIMEKKL